MKNIACLVLFSLFAAGCSNNKVELWSTDFTTEEGRIFQIFEQSADSNMHNCKQAVEKIKVEMPKRFSWCKIVE